MALARLSLLKSTSFLNITSSDYDDELKNLLTTATADADNFCNRTFEQTTYTNKLFTRNKSRRNDNKFLLPESPVSSITSMSFWDTSDEQYEVENADYYLLVDELWIQYPKLGEESNASYSIFPHGVNYIKITYIAGYDTTDWYSLEITEAFEVPNDLEYAVCLMAAVKWLAGREERMSIGLLNAGIGDENVAYEKYQKGIPKESEEILKNYRKHRV